MLDLQLPSIRLDLHLHTTRSDGRHEPDVVLERCARGGLDVVALTDHDLATSVSPGVHRIGERDLLVIAGAEISGMLGGREHHLLVYFPGEVPEGFRSFCAAQCQERAVRYVRALDALGITDVAPPGPAAERGERSVTRHHLARGMVSAGHVTNVREAFARFLGDAHPYVPPLSTSFVQAIHVARSFGGITSWAHPPVAQLEPMVPELAAAGLHGLEAFRPAATSGDRKKVRSAAQRHGLVLTGGSDWHGWGDEGDLGLFRVLSNEIRPFLDLLLAGAAPGLGAA
jgi:3',5'-nucleoside bisphosphate phosphatase